MMTAVVVVVAVHIAPLMIFYFQPQCFLSYLISISIPFQFDDSIVP